MSLGGLNYIISDLFATVEYDPEKYATVAVASNTKMLHVGRT